MISPSCLPLMREAKEGEKILFCHDSGTEGEKRELRHLEALKSEGNADDGDTEHRACNEVTDSELKTAEEKPKNIDDNGACFFTVNDLFAEGRKRKSRHFDALNANGNADDGHTPKNADDKPCECEPKSAQDDPKKITDKFHGIPTFQKDLEKHRGGKIALTRVGQEHDDVFAAVFGAICHEKRRMERRA